MSNVHEMDAEIRDEGSGKALSENPAGARGPVSRRNNMSMRGKKCSVNSCQNVFKTVPCISVGSKKLLYQFNLSLFCSRPRVQCNLHHCL